MFEIRSAGPSDAEAIRQIYNHEVTTSTVTLDLEPRTLEEQRNWLVERSGALAVIVAVGNPDTPAAGEVLGFASLSAYRDRPAYRTTVEDSIYVHHEHQGLGVGKALLAALLERAVEHGFHSVIGRIVGAQEASLALHQSLGFELVGIEREVGRKFGTWLDVALVQKLL